MNMKMVPIREKQEATRSVVSSDLSWASVREGMSGRSGS